MSEAFEAAVAAVREKVAAGGGTLDGTVKFAIPDEGVIVLHADGTVATEDAPADVTITASLDTFRDMFQGALSPTAAFMTGRLEIEGDMGAAMRLGKMLA